MKILNQYFYDIILINIINKINIFNMYYITRRLHEMNIYLKNINK